MRTLSLLILVLGTLCSFGQTQGIKGQVYWIAGNAMPGPGRETAPTLGVERELVVYELTTIRQTDSSNPPFFKDINTRLVATVRSRRDGSFKVKLPPGDYSVFVKEASGLFANTFNAGGEINHVKVIPRRYSWITITLDYEASY